MVTLYAPEPPQPPHKCETGRYVGFDPPSMVQGAVIECKTCGQLWHAEREDKPAGEGYVYTVFWRKVCWYHFDLRKKARENG